MAKYHVNSNGEAGQCKALKGGCPFGDATEHFSTAEAARDHYEDTMNSNNGWAGPSVGGKPKKTKRKPQHDYSAMSLQDAAEDFAKRFEAGEGVAPDYEEAFERKWLNGGEGLAQSKLSMSLDNYQAFKRGEVTPEQIVGPQAGKPSELAKLADERLTRDIARLERVVATRGRSNPETVDDVRDEIQRAQNNSTIQASIDNVRRVQLEDKLQEFKYTELGFEFDHRRFEVADDGRTLSGVADNHFAYNGVSYEPGDKLRLNSSFEIIGKEVNDKQRWNITTINDKTGARDTRGYYGASEEDVKSQIDQTRFSIDDMMHESDFPREDDGDRPVGFWTGV